MWRTSNCSSKHCIEMFLYWNFPLRHFGSQRFPQSLIRNRVSHLVFTTRGHPASSTPHLKCGMRHKISRSTSMRTSRGTTIMSLFPWLQSHLVGWEGWQSSSSEKSLEPRHQPDCSTERKLSKTAKGGGFMLNNRPFQ